MVPSDACMGLEIPSSRWVAYAIETECSLTIFPFLAIVIINVF